MSGEQQTAHVGRISGPVQGVDFGGIVGAVHFVEVLRLGLDVEHLSDGGFDLQPAQQRFRIFRRQLPTVCPSKGISSQTKIGRAHV